MTNVHAEEKGTRTIWFDFHLVEARDFLRIVEVWAFHESKVKSDLFGHNHLQVSHSFCIIISLTYLNGTCHAALVFDYDVITFSILGIPLWDFNFETINNWTHLLGDQREMVCNRFFSTTGGCSFRPLLVQGNFCVTYHCILVLYITITDAQDELINFKFSTLGRYLWEGKFKSKARASIIAP